MHENMKKNSFSKAISIIIALVFFYQATQPVYANGNHAFSVGAECSVTMDTREAALQAAQTYRTAGYSSTYTVIPTYDILGSSHSDGVKFLESDVVFLDGHGDNNTIGFPLSALRVGNKDGSYYWGTNNFHWGNVKLVILMGCETAKYGDSITHRVNWGGATTSVGFPETIYVSASNDWGKRFNDKLATGSTVNDAKSYANSFSYPLMSSIKNATIVGDGDLRITTTRNYLTLGEDSEIQNIDTLLKNDVNGVQEINYDKNIKLENLKKINIEKNIIFENNSESKEKIFNLLENTIKDFNRDNYEITIQKTDTDKENYSIDVLYKIEDFYTNSSYVITIEDGKIIELIDHIIEIDITDHIKNNLKNTMETFLNRKLELLKMKTKFNIEQKNNVDVIFQDYMLFYDITKDKKYAIINSENVINDSARAIDSVRYEI